MLSIHDILAFIEYERYFQFVEVAHAAQPDTGAAAPSPIRPSGSMGPDGSRYHRRPAEADLTHHVPGERVT